MAGVRRSTRLLFGGLAVLLVAVVVSVGLVVMRAMSTPEEKDKPPFPVPAIAAAPKPVLAPAGAGGVPATTAGLTKALAGPLADPRLGASVSAVVVDTETGAEVFGRRSTAAATPASSLKLATSVTALTALGPDHRFTTRVVNGPEPGTIVLVGGGDVMLGAGKKSTYPSPARIDQLAAQVKKARGDSPKVTKVLVDTSRYTGSDRAPGWVPADLATEVAPVQSVMVDGGRTSPEGRQRTKTPAVDAGQTLAQALGADAAKIAVGTAASGAKELGSVRSAPLSSLVEFMLRSSDNLLAEILAHEASLARKGPGSFAGGANATKAVLGELGVPTGVIKLSDASGLSIQNKLSAQVLARVVATAAGQRPRLRSVLSGLPVAGFSGTLDDRFTDSTGRGVVRAKTGTLTGVSSLTGLVLDGSGRQLAFSIVADKVPAAGTDSAEDALDTVGTALSKCGCQQ